MIGICLIFLGGYSLIQEWKDQKKNTTKKEFDQNTDAFFKENISTNEITMHFFLENPEKYRLEQPKNLYPSMNQGSVFDEKTAKYIYGFDGLFKKTEKSFDVSVL